MSKDERQHARSAVVKVQTESVTEKRAVVLDLPAIKDQQPLPPATEVLERPARRTFTAEFKRRIVEEAAAATEPGAIGALLRRHGLYSSHLTKWRELYQAGALSGLSPRKRGPKVSPKNPLTEQVAQLEREKTKLEKRLAQAATIIDFQKKVSEILGISLSQPDSDGDD